MPNNMDYSLIHHSPDGTGMFLVTLPGTPDRGSYMTEQEFKEWIVSSIGGGIIPKGDILSTNLPPADDTNKGWQYYCTDLNKYAVSDGTAWIYFSNSPIVQTPDATDTGHALSNAVVTQCCNEVKGRLDQHDARLQNLEQKAGDEIVVDYPSSTYGMDEVPANVAEYAKVTKLRGVSRVRNNIARGAYSRVVAGLAITYDSTTNRITITGTANSSGDYTFYSQAQSDYVAGHKYLAITNCKTSLRLTANGAYSDFTNSTLFTFSSGTVFFGINAVNGTTYNEDFYICIKDLNIYFNTTDLSFLGATDSAKLATIQTNYPELLIPSDYDTGSLVSTTYSAVKAWARNLWDETWELGNIDGTTGQNEPNTSLIRSTGYIEVGYGEHYAQINGYNTRIFFYDADKNFLSYYDRTGNGTFSVPSGVKYIRFRMNTAYGTVYQHNICINISDSQNGTYTPYHAPHTLTLPEPVTGKSAGSVHQIYYPETGEMTEPLGTKNLGDQDIVWNWDDGGDGAWSTTYFNSFIKKPSSNIEVGDILCPKYVAVNNEETYAHIKIGISVAANGKVRIYDPSLDSSSNIHTLLADVPFTYALATPNPNSQATDPVLDPFIKVEGGGTIRPVQSQTTQIDSAMSVDYLGV